MLTHSHQLLTFSLTANFCTPWRQHSSSFYMRFAGNVPLGSHSALGIIWVAVLWCHTRAGCPGCSTPGSDPFNLSLLRANIQILILVPSRPQDQVILLRPACRLMSDNLSPCPWCRYYCYQPPPLSPDLGLTLGWRIRRREKLAFAQI